MNTSKLFLRLAVLTALLATAPYGLRAGTITFAEYDALPNDAAIPMDQLPSGLPDGVTASWTGFALHTAAGDTPMSVYPTGAQAVLAFSPGAIVSSINFYDTSWGDAVTIIGKFRGIEVWRYESPGDHDWQKLTMGAGKVVDQVVCIGKWNHYDDIVVDPAPDTDGDSFIDADELLTGHNPNDPSDNPDATKIADSVTQFNTTGIQGENDWYGGYRNFSKDGGEINYDPDKDFLPFPDDKWVGSGWDLDPTGAPWTELYNRAVHPNGSNNGDVHWVIRRWVATQITKVTPLAFRWHAHHQNITCGGNGGNGVTGALYRNGKLLDSAVLGGPDNVGVIHTYYVNVNPGDRFDLALSPRGLDGADEDGCDGSQTWFLVDTTIPGKPLQPDGSTFFPVGGVDSDKDGLPDAWEKLYFANDLTKLTATGDYDKDGLSDVLEYQRLTDPTKADTDGDGLTDVVETGTGVFVSKTDTGSNPLKADTDGDTLTDAAEVNAAVATNPNKADTDGDGYSDPDEISWGTDPTNPKDYATAFVIANSEADFSGTQGKNDWSYGYRIYDPTTAKTNYNATADFIPFPGGEGQGEWDGSAQTWNGAWDLNKDDGGPWTYEAALDVHPNGVNSPPTIGGTADPTNEQWVIRRWVAKKITNDTPVTLVWSVKKTNLGGDGVTGMVFVNGNLVDLKSIEGPDGVGEIRRCKVTLKPNDIVDLALSPEGPTGNLQDGRDGSQNWLWVDTRTSSNTQMITVERVANGLKLSFTGTLQSAAKVEGPYGGDQTSSPVTVVFSSATAQFYRLKP